MENKSAITQIGKFLFDKRTYLNMTLREAAEQIDVSPQFLSDVEKGKKMFPVKRGFQKRSETIKKIYQLSESEYYKFLDMIGEAKERYFPKSRNLSSSLTLLKTQVTGRISVMKR